MTQRDHRASARRHGRGRRHHVYLVPGFLGFASLGRISYFGHVRRVFAKRFAALGVDARIHVVRTHPLHVRGCQDAALGDQDAAGRDARAQLEGGVEARLESAQVAVVDADERRVERERALELCSIVRLDQHCHAEAPGDALQLAHLRQLQRSHDQQDAVGPHRARLEYLHRFEHEILAQDRQPAGRSRRAQVVLLVERAEAEVGPVVAGVRGRVAAVGHPAGGVVVERRADGHEAAHHAEVRAAGEALAVDGVVRVIHPPQGQNDGLQVGPGGRD